MKFPKELSKERLSLLSPEDRKIYEQEHSKDKQFEEFNIEEPLFEDDIVFTNDIVSEELDSLYNDALKDLMNYNDFLNFKLNLIENNELKNIYNSYKNDIKITLNEGAEGIDAFGWIKGLSLAPLIAILVAGLTGLASVLGTLLLQGKQAYCLYRLKQLMNRLVEVVDNGIEKKKPWYSFLLPKKKAKYAGELNIGCFKTILETSDRNMTNGVMDAAMKLGFFASGEMMNIKNSDNPLNGSGLDAFKNNILSKINIIS